MTEQTIDFGNFSKKIIVNPIVPLQVSNITYRNSARLQATILGKVYSTHIEILEIVPIALCENNKIKTIDFAEHQKSLQNIMTVYPALQIIGVAVTDLKPDINLAVLHTMYSNKESGFKAQGILVFPIILSINTKFNGEAKNFQIEAYTYNQSYKICKDVMEVTAFDRLQVTISLGDSDFQSMVPLFQALSDHDEIVPEVSVEQLMEILAKRFKQLKLKCQIDGNSELKIKLRQITDKLNSKHNFSMEELSYLLDLAGLHKRIALKMNKFL